MKCSRCQQDNPVPDAQFCPRCGAPVKQVDGSVRLPRCWQVEYDFTADGQELRLHAGCSGLWEAERRRRGWRRKSQPES
jgi:zinc-ribbon domain